MSELPSTGRLNTLGLSKRELDMLLDEIDAPGKKGGAANRRFVRRAFRHLRLPFQIHQPGGNSATFPVACRNISRTGMSVLHSAYVHVNTRCTLTLPNASGPALIVNGTVMRCEHRRGMVHEIGVRFDGQVDLRPLLGLEAVGDWFSLERVSPEELHGRVLYVEDCAVDRQLLRRHLKDADLIVTPAESFSEGLAKAPTGFDIIISASHLPGGDAGGFVEQLRSRSIGSPVIVLVNDPNDPVRRRLASAANVAILAKPVNGDLLLRALAEFLIVAPEAHPGSTRPGLALDNESIEELVTEFLADLPRLIGALTQARVAGQAESCRQICLKIKGSALTLRFTDLANVADLAAVALATKADVAIAAPDLDRLTELCRNPHALQAA